MKYTALSRLIRSPLALLSAALLLIWCVGMLGRGYWTPDEPREADIAWRMSWQPEKAVPLLAGDVRFARFIGSPVAAPQHADAPNQEQRRGEQRER